MFNEVGNTLVSSLNANLQALVAFVPRFVTGLVILLIGIIVASVVKQLILSLFTSLRIEAYLKRYGVPEMRAEYGWGQILSEIGRWFVIIIFLLPTADVWGLPRVGNLLSELLLYIPNVFVAAVVGLVGLVLARLSHDVVLASAKGLTADSAKALAAVTQWAIAIFVGLVVLEQLGVASDMIRILFTGVVAMLALAGGIAFGLGGQDTARDVLSLLRKRLK